MKRLKFALFVAVLAVPVLASPALAQNKKNQHEAAAEAARAIRDAREAEKEAAYRKAIRTIPEQQTKPKDPWANMR